MKERILKPAIFVASACESCDEVVRALEDERLRGRLFVHDVTIDAAADVELTRVTGGDRVPCLVLRGKPPLFGPDAILRRLEDIAARTEVVHEKGCRGAA